MNLKNKKSLFITVLFIALMFFSTAAEFSDTHSTEKQELPEPDNKIFRLTPQEQKWLDEHKELRIAITGNGAPIQFFGVEGQLKGIAVDFLEFLSKRIGFQIEYIKANDIQSSLELIKEKKADVALSVTPTPERFKYMDFSSPYLEMNPVIIVRKGDNENLALDSLNKHRVAIIKDSAIAEFIKFNYPNINLIYVPDPYSGLTLVSTGGVDAFISNMLEASYYIESEGIINLKVAGKTDYVTRVTFGVRKDYSVLADILNKGISSTSETERKLILNQWTSFNNPRIPGKEFWIVILIISGTLLGTLILIIVWNFSLKRQVILRTRELVNELAERQKAEKEITKYRDHLEDLVKKRTAILNETNEKLKAEIIERNKVETALSEAKELAEDANRAKSLFLANMSHEIRTPMNVILGFSQLLCRDRSLTGEQKLNLETIDRSGKHLLKLIDQILEMTKIEAGKLTLNEEIFDLHLMLRDMEIMFKIRAIDNKLLFSVNYNDSIPRFLIGDPGKIRQIFVNLLGNAIKYTDKGFVKLDVELINEKEESAEIRFSVEDTGEGINQDEEYKLFSVFSQTKSGIKGGKGTGLGLAISQKYIKLMGSEILYKRRAEGGSVFYFEIKLKKGAKTDIEKIKDDLPRQVLALKEKFSGKIKILICEDEKQNRELLSKLLIDTGFIVKTANNGEEGLKIINNYEPDLILLDLRMPVMDGYETIKKIRTIKKFSYLPVFAVTANVFDEDKNMVLKAGFNEFLGKPIEDNKLLMLMKKYLEIEYIFEEKTGSKLLNEEEINIDQDEELETIIPEEIKKTLIKAIEAADYDDIFKKLEKIKSLNKKLAKKLYLSAESFEYEKMLQILNKE